MPAVEIVSNCGAGSRGRKQTLEVSLEEDADGDENKGSAQQTDDQMIDKFSARRFLQ